MQIYGIDLAKEKFDVSFLRLSSKSNVVTPVHHVVRNTENGIKAFLKGLPSDSVLVAEHTGVYGERLLKMCTEMNFAASSAKCLKIADLLNFPNASAFGTFFKKQVGMSPINYRQKQG